MLKSIGCLLIFLGLIQIKSNAQQGNVDSAALKKELSMIWDSTKPQLISNQYSFTEGPSVDKKGNVFFSDQPNDKIYKWNAATGQVTVFLQGTGRSNGMIFDKKGNLITCADEHNEIWSIKPNGKVKVLLKDIDGLHLNGPNDLWIDGKGGIYITDPYYQRPYWTRKAPEIKGQNVYYVPKGKAPVVVADNLMQPNGIIGTPDGKYLFVADIRGNKTYKYSISPDGMLKDQTLFIPKGSDGMVIDNKGNIYITGKGITIYNPQGQQIGYIDITGDRTTNVAFGGKERNILFITAMRSVYTLQMKVKGVE
jgi:gluconolactonase